MEAHPETLEICVEVPRGGRIKRRPDGSIDFMSPFASPFNYGSVTGRRAADGDPEDALVLGPPLSPGSVVQRKVWGRVVFQDAGVADHTRGSFVRPSLSRFATGQAHPPSAPRPPSLPLVLLL